VDLKKNELEDLVNTALAATEKSNDILMKHWTKYHDRKQYNMEYTTKEDLSPVTQLDLEVEKNIRDLVLTKYPGHKIVGEEFGEEEAQYKTSPYIWIIDPIDGTANYIRKLRYFATQIAIMHEGEVIVGISNAPALGETLVAFKNGGAFLNKERVHVSKVRWLQNSFLIHGSIKYFKQIKKLSQLIKLDENSWSMRGFGDCWSYHLLASGGIDAMLEAKTKIWDIAAVSLIVKEAGGRVTDIYGNPLSLRSTSIIASNGLIHDEILSIIHSK
jgi:histidinol-phosphatase